MTEENKTINEFAQIAEDEFSGKTETQTTQPENKRSQYVLADDESPEGDSPFTSSEAGTIYDFNDAPDTVRSPDRIDLDGQMISIVKAELTIPPESWEWQKAKHSDTMSKNCPFKIHYKTEDGQLQIENYSGVKVFQTKDGKYGQPTIWKEGKTQAAKLMATYAKFMEKDIKEVTMRQFGNFLNSGIIKGKIKATEVTNPTNEETFMKNVIVEFVQ